MPEAMIVESVRTPIGRHGGTLSGVRPDDLAAIVLREVVKRAGVDPQIVEEVYLGCANQAGEDNRDVARMALLLAGFPVHVSGVTFNRLCASGLAAINAAARAIKIGEGEVYIAGGVESMSRAPWAVPKSEGAFSFGNVTMYDTTLGWRFPNSRLQEMFPLESMGETAENIAELEKEITREQQDGYALESHRRAIAAIDSGKFAEEIVPISIPQKKGEAVVVSTDEHPRRDTSLEKLASLKAGLSQGRDGNSGKRVRHQRWCRSHIVDERREGSGARPQAVSSGRRVRGGRSRSPHDGVRARTRDGEGFKAGRAED